MISDGPKDLYFTDLLVIDDSLFDSNTQFHFELSYPITLHTFPLYRRMPSRDQRSTGSTLRRRLLRCYKVDDMNNFLLTYLLTHLNIRSKTDEHK